MRSHNEKNCNFRNTNGECLFGVCDSKKTIVTCLNKDCPERRSVCCGAKSCIKLMQDGQTFDKFVCEKCGKEFVGNPCKSINKIKCQCACHENKLKKPYIHDTKCCDEMNGEINQEDNQCTCAGSEVCRVFGCFCKCHRCICPFDDDTKREIGHVVTCPQAEGYKTWWQEKEESNLKVTPSPRIDYCDRCDKDHGFDCPREWQEKLCNKASFLFNTNLLSENLSARELFITHITDLLIQILAEMESAPDAKTARHILKDYILND